MLQDPRYKKTVFLCARRAMLENEIVLQRFAKEYVPRHYTVDELDSLNFFLENIYDNDLYEVIMGLKPAEKFQDQYEFKYLKDIENFAKLFREEQKKQKKHSS
ncbi:MAG: succinate dehydrogenase assembly factor 2 [Calditerrivibrio sp.]|nr:succinate dehydrogenase assembly factor 2 [Calditerrivibrio sp.]